jgi:CubicO group peptidase (beta-lactamase class C family)
MLHHGRWESRTVLDSALVAQAVTPFAAPRNAPATRPAEPRIPGMGLGWWTNRYGALPELPPDAFLGTGDGGQMLLVVPSMDLIVVRFGSGIRGISMGPSFWGQLRSELLAPLMECFRDEGTVTGPEADPPSS